MSSRERRAQEIQDEIRAVLLREWDPIGVRDVPETQDEYDGCIGGVYRLLANGATAPELVEHLARIERDSMGLSPQLSNLGDVASRLKQINVSLEPS